MSQRNEKSHEDQLKDLRHIISDIKYGMLTTLDKEGCLHSRPMATLQLEEDGSLYFFIKNDSMKCLEINKNHQVNLSFSEPKNNQYVSLSGKGYIIEDRQKMKELWNPFFKAWFPKGLEEPNIALLRINVEKAEYWDYPKGVFVRLIGFAKALFTKEPAEDIGTNEKIRPPFAGEKENVLA